MFLTTGMIAYRQAKFAEAQDLFQQRIVIAKQLGYQRKIAEFLIALGDCALQQEQFTAAETLFQEAMTIGMTIKNKYLEAEGSFGLAQLRKARGNLDEARTLGKESFQLFAFLHHKSAQKAQAWLATLPA